MNEKEAFGQVLDADEMIVRTFKPHKLRFIGLGILGAIIKAVPAIIFGLAFIIIFSIIGNQDPEEMSCEINGVEATGEECSSFIGNLSFIGWIIIGLALLGVVISIVAKLVKYNKTMYCYTTKRIIMRTGFIGADYQTLDFDAISAMNVRVDFLDKLVKPNTGTVWFASAAAPMVGAGIPGGVSNYAFVCIEKPYDVYKEIKEYISKNKDNNLNS